ncbi:programmed cell death protein 2 [Amyelois transitella]|uniref:programmed cell death protein 2 n=1 Tax=Amyelois transitella TaxID=680683 RepID=UPI00067B43D0|nr:programmed cell death protein 2 [Amyelois transitella]
MSENKIDIGILEEKCSWLLHPRFFPSKIGGKPAWLDLQNLPIPFVLSCKKCKDPLVFLCQIYAPYEEDENSFHRTIFIFICRNGPCCQPNSSENFLVLRCQLPRKNPFYSYEPYEENENEVFPMDKWANLCDVCGIKGPSHCAKCKKVYYCSRKHQILDWQKGHKEYCSVVQQNPTSCKINNFIVTESGKSILFKEWELIVDEEDEEDKDNVDVNHEMEKLRKLMQEKKAGSLDNVSDTELEQYTRPLPEDKVFNKFSKRVARHPDQVLRYDRDGHPLWITGNSDSFIDIPKCQYCNGERQFEFQIMPQLLNFIDVGIDLNSIDWGVLAVYTCKRSCNGGPSYKEEYIIKQDLTN